MKLKSSALTILSFLVFFGISCWFAGQVNAAEYQNCFTAKNCTIGEFLYDDTYAPDATASCTLTSRNPDGTLFLNNAAMTASASGWYSYSAVIGTTEGIYPSQICCDTSTSDHLCLDKTFKVVAGASASDVWSYPNRSLTTFGSLVADIWNNSTRSLSTFGDLVSNIWTGDSRTLTGTDSATLQTSLAEIREIKRVNLENRLLLEQLINKPIIKTFIDDTELPNLSEKLQKTNSAAANLYSGVQNLKSRSVLLNEKWTTLTDDEIKSELTTLSSILKQDYGAKDSNILATAIWLKTSWNSPILLNLSDQAQAAQSNLDNLINDLNLYGKGTKPDAFAPALSHIQKLDELVGSSLATPLNLNLYGFIKKVTEQIAFLDKQSAEGVKLLTAIKTSHTIDHSGAITLYQSTILASNQLPQVDSFMVSSLKKALTPTNKVLGLMAIVDTNRLLLSANTGQPVKNIWLEEGSIIFRAVAINPSHSLTQKVTVKYFLPAELKKEQIIKYDPELKIDYDPVENALFAMGEVSLSPNESQTFLVEVEDIWNYKQEEIDSLKNQVNDLVNLLKGTTHYTEAVAIKTDINVALDKIMLRQAQAITPENRIRTYRESQLEMNGIEQKITSIKELALSGSMGGFLGTLGGVQAITLWGIILIVVAGVAFLVIYLNALRSDALLTKDKQKDIVVDALEEHDAQYHPAPKYRHREPKTHLGHRIARIASIALLTGGLSSIGASYTIRGYQSRPTALVSPSPDAVVLGTSSDIKYPYESKLIAIGEDKVPVRSAASLSSPEILSLSTDQKVFVFKIVDNWAQIGLFEKDQEKGWWINTQYLELK
jgi:hypothetical protein